MIYGYLQIGYEVALAALTTGIILKGTGPMRRTIATVFLSLLAGLYFASLWPGVSWAIAMIVIDTLACIAITWHPAGKWQSLIGLSYILQIGVHIGRIAAQNPDIVSYWWGLSILAFVQLLLIGGWWLYDGLGFHFRRSDPDSRPHPSRHQGVV